MNALPNGFLLFAQMVPEVSDPWAETLFGLDPDKRFVLLLVSIGCAIGLILGALGIVAGTINSIHRRRVQADMKRDMIDRGMSADEIAKIVAAATPPEDATERWVDSMGCKKK